MQQSTIVNMEKAVTLPSPFIMVRCHQEDKGLLVVSKSVRSKCTSFVGTTVEFVCVCFSSSPSSFTPTSLG